MSELVDFVPVGERRELEFDLAKGKDRTEEVVAVKKGMFADYTPSALQLVKFEKQIQKKEFQRKARSLGIGKHAAGNAHTLANHKRVPGEVTVGEGKTVAGWKRERAQEKKRKNKMARKSRARNRR